MKQVQDAAKLLARRYDQSSLRTASHISMIGNDKQQGLMYTQRVVQQHLLQYEWKEAYSFLKSQKDLQVRVFKRLDFLEFHTKSVLNVVPSKMVTVLVMEFDF